MYKTSIVIDHFSLSYEEMKKTITFGNFQPSIVETTQFHHIVTHVDPKCSAKVNLQFAMNCSPFNKKVDKNGKKTYSLHASLYKNTESMNNNGSIPYTLSADGQNLEKFFNNIDKLYAEYMDSKENEEIKRKALIQIGLSGPTLNIAMGNSFSDYIVSRVERQYDEDGITEVKSPTFPVKLWTSTLTETHETKRKDRLVLKNAYSSKTDAKKDEIVWTEVFKHNDTVNGGYSIDPVKSESDLERYIYIKDDNKNNIKPYFDMEVQMTITLPTYYGSKQSGKVTGIYKLNTLFIDRIIPRESKKGLSREKAHLVHEMFINKRKSEDITLNYRDNYYDPPFSQPNEFNEYRQPPPEKKIKYREVVRYAENKEEENEEKVERPNKRKLEMLISDDKTQPPAKQIKYYDSEEEDDLSTCSLQTPRF